MNKKINSVIKAVQGGIKYLLQSIIFYAVGLVVSCMIYNYLIILSIVSETPFLFLAQPRMTWLAGAVPAWFLLESYRTCRVWRRYRKDKKDKQDGQTNDIHKADCTET